jgi:hypothetical protein
MASELYDVNLYDEAEERWRKALDEQAKADIAAGTAEEETDWYPWDERTSNSALPGRPIRMNDAPEMALPIGLKNLHGTCYIITAYTILLNLPLFVGLVLRHKCKNGCIVCLLREFALTYHSRNRKMNEVERTSRALTEHCEISFWGPRARSHPRRHQEPLDEGGNEFEYLELLLCHVRQSLLSDFQALQEFDQLFSTEIQVMHRCPNCKHTYEEGYRRYLTRSYRRVPTKPEALDRYIKNQVVTKVERDNDDIPWCRPCTAYMKQSVRVMNLPVYLLSHPDRGRDDYAFKAFVEELVLDTVDGKASYELHNVAWHEPEHVSALVRLLNGFCGRYRIWHVDNSRANDLSDTWVGASRILDVTPGRQPSLLVYVQVSAVRNMLNKLSGISSVNKLFPEKSLWNSYRWRDGEDTEITLETDLNTNGADDELLPRGLSLFSGKSTSSKADLEESRRKILSASSGVVMEVCRSLSTRCPCRTSIASHWMTCQQCTSKRL